MGSRLRFPWLMSSNFLEGSWTSSIAHWLRMKESFGQGNKGCYLCYGVKKGYIFYFHSLSENIQVSSTIASLATWVSIELCVTCSMTIHLSCPIPTHTCPTAITALLDNSEPASLQLAKKTNLHTLNDLHSFSLSV